MSQQDEAVTLAVPAGAAASAHPARIAGYEIQRLIGEGGMGRVYLAREAHPPRDVALKLVRGLSESAAARFRREAQLLAPLEHSGIARLYAAGEADVGGLVLPWLALEYVRGADLVTHAQQHRLDLPARLKLLVAVCRAVHYAHGRGVIHRDLKPANILVGEDGEPKVLDFGIAHLRDDADTGMTQAGQVLGTVPYMSPEQLAGRSREVDARSDVYALGVVAYELVAQRLPHPRLSTSTLLDALAIVRNEDPPRIGTLVPSARGDLDHVIMKALATEPERRYASAAQLGADLERVLDHRPVEARAPTFGYLASRIVRRHRALSAAIAAIALVLVGATIVSLRYAASESQARRETEARAAELAAVNGFLDRMLASADPAQTRGDKLSVSTVVDTAAGELDSLEPRARLAVLTTLASTRLSLGQYAQGLDLNNRALALAAEVGAPAGDVAWLQRQHASLETELGHFDAARAAINAARSAQAALTPLASLGVDLTAARIEDEAGKPDLARDGYRGVVEKAKSIDVAATQRGETAATMSEIARSNLAAVLRDSGAVDEATALSRAVYADRLARLGERHPLTLASRHKLALSLAAQGLNDQAEAEARPTLAAQRQVLGDTHASTLTTIQSLANIVLPLGKLDETEALTREALAGFEAQLGDAHAQTLASMNTLAYLLEERKRVDEAEALYRRIIEIQTRQGVAHPSTLAPRNNLAMLLLTAGKFDDAHTEFASLVTDAKASVGDEHAMTAIFRSNYGLCLTRERRYADARDVLEASHARLAASLGAQHARTRTAASRLADVYDALGDADRAGALRESAAERKP
jgi:tetratricopeptide (TPR) repeat protein